jgi:hypothetical protein
MPTVAYQKQECMQIAVEDTICKNMSKGSFTLSKFAAKNAQGLETNLVRASNNATYLGLPGRQYTYRIIPIRVVPPKTRAKADTVLSLSRVELLHSFCCF